MACSEHHRYCRESKNYSHLSKSKMWDAVTVAVTLLPSDKRRDLLYYYTDGSLGSAAGWYYLYDLSTSINRANGTTAGIVEDSTNGDVTLLTVLQLFITQKQRISYLLRALLMELLLMVVLILLQPNGEQPEL